MTFIRLRAYLGNPDRVLGGSCKNEKDEDTINQKSHQAVAVYGLDYSIYVLRSITSGNIVNIALAGQLIIPVKNHLIKQQHTILHNRRVLACLLSKLKCSACRLKQITSHSLRTKKYPKITKSVYI